MKTKRPGRGWAYACAQLGGVASIAANVAHSWVPPAGAAPDVWQPPAGAVIASVFWPVALLFAIEAFARVAWPNGWRYALLRFCGLLPVALVAAVVSYLHLSGLLASYRAGWFEVHVGPLAVDGLMVIGTSALIATSRARALDLRPEVPTPPAAPVVPAELPHPEPVSVQVSADPTPVEVPPELPPANPAEHAGKNGKVRRPADETRRLARALQAGDTSLTPKEIADLLGVTTRRLRDVLAATSDSQ